MRLLGCSGDCRLRCIRMQVYSRQPERRVRRHRGRGQAVEDRTQDHPSRVRTWRRRCSSVAPWRHRGCRATGGGHGRCRRRPGGLDLDDDLDLLPHLVHLGLHHDRERPVPRPRTVGVGEGGLGGRPDHLPADRVARVPHRPWPGHGRAIGGAAAAGSCRVGQLHPLDRGVSWYGNGGRARAPGRAAQQRHDHRCRVRDGESQCLGRDRLPERLPALGPIRRRRPQTQSRVDSAPAPPVPGHWLARGRSGRGLQAGDGLDEPGGGLGGRVGVLVVGGGP